MWVNLVEKAWAKCHGSYGAIESYSNIQDILHDLTGAPVEVKDIGKASPAQAESLVMDAHKDKWMMVVSTKARRVPNMFGLMEHHYYSVISAEAVPDKLGTKYNLIKLRNPDGESSWTGEWSNQDKNRWGKKNKD